jgi:hypothetical protein
LKRSGIRHGLQIWCAVALLPVRLHIVKNAGAHLDGETAAQYQGTERNAIEQSTIRERLHGKFTLDLSGSLHDLPETRENVIILRIINKDQSPRMPVCRTSERTSRRIWRSFDCSMVSKHAFTSTFTKYNFGLEPGSMVSSASPSGYHGSQESRWAARDKTRLKRLQLSVNFIMAEY